MSLPSNLRDDLLSGYLDGQLSVDERSRIEQLLSTSAELREQLAELERNQQRLRVHRNAAKINLPNDFADRVLRATFAEARTSNLPANHPVQLAASAAALGTSDKRSYGRVGWLSAAGALAASLALVFVWSPSTPPTKVGLVTDIPTASPSETEIVENVPAVAVPQEINLDPVASKVVDLANSKPPSNAPDLIGGDPISNPPPLSADLAASTSPGSPDRVVPKRQIPKLMMVFDVRLADFEDVRPIERALQNAGVGALTNATVDAKLVNQLAKARFVASSSSSSDEVQVLVIEAPARRLQQFLVELSRKPDGVAGFGFSITEDKTLIEMVQSLNEAGTKEVGVETTRTSVAHRLTLPGPDSNGHLFQSTNSAIPFINLGEATIGQLPSLGDQGPDFLSTVMVLVR